MKKIAKRMISVLAIASIAVSMAACDKKEENEKIKVKMWTALTQDASPKQIAYHDKLMEGLKKNFPNYEFEEMLKPVGTDYRQEYDKALMANNAPSFVDIFSYTDIPTRIANGTIADVTKYVENWDLRKEGKVITTFDDAITSKDDKWYGIPRSSYMIGCMVNTKSLADADENVETLPATWEEFAAQGQRVTDLSVPRFGYSLMGMDWCAWPYTAWVWSAGGEMVRKNDDGTYKLAFNEEAGVDAAVFLNEMIWKYKMTQKDVLMGTQDLNNVVRNGSACYAWAQYDILSEEAVKQYGLKMADFTQMLLPSKDESIPRVALAGGEIITFNPKLSEKELEAAVNVAKYMFYSEEMLDYEVSVIEETGHYNFQIPGRVDYYEKKINALSWMTDEIKNNLAEMQKNTKPEPYCPHWSEIKTALVKPLQEIYLTDGITRERVQELLDNCANELYKAYPNELKNK